MTDSGRANQIPDGGVKIDGLREPEHAVAAADAGADLIGFIFAPTRRYVPPAKAAECIKAARRAGARSPLAVGVFVNAMPAEINSVAVQAGLDVVQLHGDEPPETLAAIELPVIRAVRPPAGMSVADVRLEVERYESRPPLIYLLDGRSAEGYGGVGARADWALGAALAFEIPLMLAGGLNPENVAEAIRTVRPRAVDVSSGVETDGVKDPRRIEAFVRAAKLAFAVEVGAG